MEFRSLGASGVKVSTLCLGTMTFGEADANSFMHKVGCDEATAHRIMSRALDAGVNFVDVADVYGQNGLSETVVGNWNVASGKRDQIVLATKFRFRMADGPNGTGASRLRILRAVEDSLKRLRTDRIDLYQIHMQDRETPEDETLRALDDLVRQGKVLYLGASNYAAYRLVESLWISKTTLRERFVTLQALYSLVDRDLEREHIPLCLRYGLGVLPYSPLAAGFLTGKIEKDAPAPAGTRLEKNKARLQGYATDRHWRILDAVKRTAAELGRAPAEIALAWLIRKPAVTSVIFGARTLEQLESNLGGAAVTLSDAHMKQLDEASAFQLGYPYEFIRNVQGSW